MRVRSRSFVLVVLLATALAVTGCVEVRPEDVPEWVPSWLQPSAPSTSSPQPAAEEDLGWEEGIDSHGRAMPDGSHGHGVEVLMLGRSVMHGWFDHWGWAGRNPVVDRGYARYYGELAPPPDIADSAIEYIDHCPQTTVVFYKLCFADFWARDAQEVHANVEENLTYARRVASAAESRGIRLVLGTSLPETDANTTGPLVETHTLYDAGIRSIAREHSGVYVFDLHAILSNQIGALYKSFAVWPTDAHLTDAAYDNLDSEFFDFMDETFGPES